MFWELWQSWRTPVYAPFVKKMGYLHEAIAMVARAKRCAQPWQQHYLECQKVIQTAIPKAANRRKVLVFGAGSLNDLPLEALATQFEQVLLVDLVFLKAARMRVAKLSNVYCIEHDVCESLAGFYRGQLEVNAPQTWLQDSEIDLVISLNLITQLPLIPVRWLMRHQGISQLQAEKIGQALIQQHLEYLQTLSGIKCLIADRQNIELNHQTGEQEDIDPWWDIQSPPVERTWHWQVAPRGERSRTVSQTNVVGVSWL